MALVVLVVAVIVVHVMVLVTDVIMDDRGHDSRHLRDASRATFGLV